MSKLEDLLKPYNLADPEARKAAALVLEKRGFAANAHYLLHSDFPMSRLSAFPRRSRVRVKDRACHAYRWLGTVSWVCPGIVWQPPKWDEYDGEQTDRGLPADLILYFVCLDNAATKDLYDEAGNKSLVEQTFPFSYDQLVAAPVVPVEEKAPESEEELKARIETVKAK